MLQIKEKLISILETYCPDNVYLQGTLNPDETFPETFITFSITDSEFDAFYNNDSNKIDWSIAVMIYSSDPNTIDTIAKGVIKDCKAAGFIPQGAGNDLPSGVDTHTGWAIDFVYPYYEANDGFKLQDGWYYWLYEDTESVLYGVWAVSFSQNECIVLHFIIQSENDLFVAGDDISDYVVTEENVTFNFYDFETVLTINGNNLFYDETPLIYKPNLSLDYIRSLLNETN